MGWIGKPKIILTRAEDYDRNGTIPSSAPTFTMGELRQLASEFVNITHSDMVYRLHLSGFLAWIEKQERTADDIDAVIEGGENRL